MNLPFEASILLLRHGAFERMFDAEGRVQEVLVETANAKAEALAARLEAAQRPVVVYAGRSTRAVMTAEHIARRFRQPVYAEADLDEMRLPRDPDLAESDTAPLWSLSRSRPDAAASPGAETLRAAGARGARALAGAVRANPGRLVVAVSHGGLIAAALAELGAGELDREIGFGACFWLAGTPLGLFAED